jgi:DNA-binding LacI/PurR family transcriptional regulator
MVVKPSENKVSWLSRKLMEDIQGGNFQAGSLLPAELDLAERYKVSRPTVRRAVAVLTEKRQLVKLPNRGVLIVDENRPTTSTRQIAFITPALTTESSLYNKGISDALDPERYTLATYCSHGNLKKYELLIEQIAGMKPAGVILQTLSEELGRVNGKVFAQAGIPVVATGQNPVPNLECDRVVISGKENSKKMVQYIQRKGYRDLAYASYFPRRDCYEFIEPFRVELARIGLSLPEERVFLTEAPHGYMEPPDPYIDAYLLAKRLLQKGFRCELLICGHDYVAVGVLRALQEAGIRVPEDMKVLSGMRNPVAGITPLHLTGFDFGQVNQGRLAAELLTRRIEGYTGAIEVHYSSVELIQGETA